MQSGQSIAYSQFGARLKYVEETLETLKQQFKCLNAKVDTDAALEQQAIETMQRGVDLARSCMHDVEQRANAAIARKDLDVLPQSELVGAKAAGVNTDWLSRTGAMLGHAVRVSDKSQSARGTMAFERSTLNKHKKKCAAKRGAAAPHK